MSQARYQYSMPALKRRPQARVVVGADDPWATPMIATQNTPAVINHETDVRFWAKYNYKPGQKLDPSIPEDKAMVPKWLEINQQVKADAAAGTLVLTHEDPGVVNTLFEAIQSGGQMLQAANDALFNRKGAAAAEDPATKAVHEAAAEQAEATVKQVSKAQEAHAKAANAAVEAAKVNNPPTAVAPHPSLFQGFEDTIEAHPVAAASAAVGAIGLTAILLRKRRGRHR